MKTKNILNRQTAKVMFTFMVFTFFCSPIISYGDIEFDGGITAEIDYLVEGSVWIYDANVIMVDPAHIAGCVITGSGAVLDIFGGQIDYILLISKSDPQLPEGVVTVFGTDFAVDGVPVSPDTTELFLQGQQLSGVYENGAPFSFPVECIIEGGANYLYYQTVKLGWIASEPDIAVSQNECNFGQADIGTTQTGVVSVCNLGNAVLTIQSLQILQDENTQFGLAPLKVVPLMLEPNTAVDVEILYNPVVEGLSQAVLQLTSNDPDNPVIQVAVSGEGIAVVLSPSQQAAQILDVFEFTVSEGLVQGVGSTQSAENKVRDFAKMLLAADELLLAGYEDSALEMLLMIEAKCDGQKSPRDFVQGDAADELNAMINELIATLQNQ